MELKEYLKSNGMKYSSFADRLNISHKTLWTIIKKGDMKLSLAIKIEEATKGQVTCRELLSKKILEDILKSFSKENPRN